MTDTPIYWSNDRGHKRPKLDSDADQLTEDELSDVELLCPPCHAIRDKTRAREGKQRASQARWNARLAGWAQRVYGEDWDLQDPDALADEFEEWLDAR